MNLSNFYITASYYGLVNLQDSTSPITSQSGEVELQDGLGNGLGVLINAQTKDITIQNDLILSGNLAPINGLTVIGDSEFIGSLTVSGSTELTGSLSVSDNITAGGTVSAGTGSFDTVNTRVLHVLVESASVILSSGSNQIGDEITDVQTIVGQTSISGSLTVIGNHSHTGNQSITGSLFVSNAISSSTIVGIGNVTLYSQSVDTSINNLSSSIDTSINNLSSSIDTTINNLSSSIDTTILNLSGSVSGGQYIQDQRLNNLEGPFSTSVDARLVSLEAFTSSQDSINSGYNAFTQSYYIDSASFDTRVDALEIFSSSFSGNFVQASTFNEFTASAATTGSNTFNGNQTINGRVNGNVTPITISSTTASIDCSQGNFFSVSLPSGSTHFRATNITAGQTISVFVNTQSGNTVSLDSSTIKFSLTQEYVPTNGSSKDVLTFISFDSFALYGVAVNTFN